MGNTTITGRKVLVKRPANQLFSLFSDLTNFAGNLPPEITDKAEIVSTQDTLIAKVHGFELGLKVQERVPYSLVKLVQYGNSPIPYTFQIFIDSLEESESSFMLKMDTELSGMFKMMIGGKLQEVVDRVTDELEKALTQ